MGSSSGPADERPVRTVTLNNRIAMGRYEVTFADYERFVATQSGTCNPGDEGQGGAGAENDHSNLIDLAPKLGVGRVARLE